MPLPLVPKRGLETGRGLGRPSGSRAESSTHLGAKGRALGVFCPTASTEAGAWSS